MRECPHRAEGQVRDATGGFTGRDCGACGDHVVDQHDASARPEAAERRDSESTVQVVSTLVSSEARLLPGSVDSLDHPIYHARPREACQAASEQRALVVAALDEPMRVKRYRDENDVPSWPRACGDRGLPTMPPKFREWLSQVGPSGILEVLDGEAERRRECTGREDWHSVNDGGPLTSGWRRSAGAAAGAKPPLHADARAGPTHAGR